MNRSSWLLTALFIIIASGIGFATTIISYPLNDTTVCNGCSGTIYNTSLSADHSSDVFLLLDDGGAGSQFDNFAQAYKLQTFIRSNNSAFNSRIISTMFMTGYNITLNGTCGDPFSALAVIRWINRDNWFDSMNYTQSPVQAGSFTHYNVSGIDAGVSIGSRNSTNFNLSNPSVMSSLYNNASSSFFINALNGKCGGAGSTASMNSLESTSPEFFEITLTDTMPITSLITDVSTFYYDFETGFISFSSFPEADFKWQNDFFNPNTLTPLGSVTARETIAEQSNTNTLDVMNCANYGGYTQTPIIDLNTPTGNYYTVCFNLTSQHNGQQFYGAIKVINNTNVRSGGNADFDFYSNLYSPFFLTFSQPTLFPNPAQQGRNLTVTWDTTQPMTSILRYASKPVGSGNYSAFSGVQELSQYVTHHSLIIPQSSMIYGDYQIYMTGNAQNGLQFSSGYYNFTTIPYQSTPFDITASVDSLGVFTFNEAGFPIPAGISLDNAPAIATSQFINSQGVTVYGVSFPRGNVPFGLHNISASSYYDSARTGNGTVNITVYPTFVSLTLRPRNSCVSSQKFATSMFCNDTMSYFNYSNIGATGKYCAYNCQECLIFNISTGACISTAGQGWLGNGANPVCWNLYLCFDGYNPTSVSIGADAGQGTIVGAGGAGSGSPIDTATGLFGEWAGFTQEQILNLIAMVITLILTMFVAIKTRDGLSTAITSVVSLFVFLLINWLPVWVLLIMGVIVAFLIAKFFRQVMTPQ